MRTDGSVDARPSFEVYLQKTDSAHRAIEVFLRDGMAILGLGRLRESGMLAIIRAENNELGSLLGDAENPAHTRWERSGKHFKDKYVHGPSILSLVRQSADRLCTFLSTSEEGQDRELLRGIFFLPETGEGKVKRRTKGPGKVSPDPPDPPKSRKPMVSVDQFSTGFKIRPHHDAEDRPERVVVKAAYETDGGNPFNFYHEADFDFSRQSGVQVTLQGLEVESAVENRLVCLVTDDDFELTAQGFDQNRDLRLDVRPIRQSQEGESDAEEE